MSTFQKKFTSRFRSCAQPRPILIVGEDRNINGDVCVKDVDRCVRDYLHRNYDRNDSDYEYERKKTAAEIHCNNLPSCSEIPLCNDRCYLTNPPLCKVPIGYTCVPLTYGNPVGTLVKL